jgi:peptidyl-prolyl cis-trans isomerase D
MAIINKMRKSGWVFVVILGALALFVLSDLISGFQKGGGMEDPIVGVVNGVDIKYSEYDEILKNRITNKEQNNQGVPLTATEREAAATEAWDDLFRKYVVEKEYEKLGLVASNDELYTLLFTDDAHPYIKQYFTQEGTPFSGANVLTWYKQVYPTNPNAQLFFNSLKDAIISSVQSEKYRDLVEKGVHVTTFDLINDFIHQSKTVDGSIVGLREEEISDTLISYTEKELQDYYNANKNNFKFKENRDFEFVVWSTFPSAYDSLEVKRAIELDIALFETAEEDSAFATIASERPVNVNFRSVEMLPKEFAALIPNAEIGKIFGPVQVGNAFAIAKLSDVQELEQPRYKYGQISIYQSWVDKKDSLEQVAKAKEIVKVINENGFEAGVQIARQEGMAVLGDMNGDIPWTTEDALDPSISDVITKGKKGEAVIKGTSGAINIIAVLEAPLKKEFKLVEIYKEIVPSMVTINENYAKASQFRSMISDGKDDKFEKAIDEAGLAKRIAKEIYRKGSSIPGLDETSEIMRWAFDEKTKLNDISEVFSIDGNQVVVHISALRKEGIAPFADVVESVKTELVKKKKLEYIENKLAEASKGKSNTIQVALEIGKISNDFTKIAFKNDYFSQANNESFVHGAIMGMKKKNELSKPLKGENGVYVAMITNIDEPAVPDDLDSRRQFINMGLFQVLESKVVSSLKKLADIKDKRENYF